MTNSFKNKKVAVTGASGTLGRALLQQLAQEQAQLIALTTSEKAEFDPAIQVVRWQPGQEADLHPLFQTVDVLIINHGLNVHGGRSSAAVEQSLQANALTGWRMMETFFAAHADSDISAPEVWINTSEAEVNPAFSPLYEISKRLMGDLVTLRRLDAPCTVRKLVLGPFKSNLNPIGVMSAEGVAWAIVALAKRDFRTIIVTINPLTYLLLPLKELAQGLYFRLLTRP